MKKFMKVLRLLRLTIVILMVASAAAIAGAVPMPLFFRKEDSIDIVDVKEEPEDDTDIYFLAGASSTD